MYIPAETIIQEDRRNKIRSIIGINLRQFRLRRFLHVVRFRAWIREHGEIWHCWANVNIRWFLDLIFDRWRGGADDCRCADRKRTNCTLDHDKSWKNQPWLLQWNLSLQSKAATKFLFLGGMTDQEHTKIDQPVPNLKFSNFIFWMRASCYLTQNHTETSRKELFVTQKLKTTHLNSFVDCPIVFLMIFC